MIAHLFLLHVTFTTFPAPINASASTMLLSTLYWPDEVRSPGELSLPEADVEIRPAERAMAGQLIDAMTNDFDPAGYHDEYREALLAIIEAKAAGEEIAEPAAAPAVGVTDLVAALEASVAAARAARASAAPETLTAKSRPRRAAKAPAPVVAVEREVEASPVRRRKSA